VSDASPFINAAALFFISFWSGRTGIVRYPRLSCNCRAHGTIGFIVSSTAAVQWRPSVTTNNRN